FGFIGQKGYGAIPMLGDPALYGDSQLTFFMVYGLDGTWNGNPQIGMAIYDLNGAVHDQSAGATSYGWTSPVAGDGGTTQPFCPVKRRMTDLGFYYVPVSPA